MKEKESSLAGRLTQQSQPAERESTPSQQQTQIIKQLLSTSNYYKSLYQESQ